MNERHAMVRLPALDLADLTEDQRKAVLEIGRSRGGKASGPFSVWIRNPRLAVAAGDLGDVLRIEGHLESRLFELAILVVARHWRASYPWSAHVRAATEAGVSAEVVEAVRLGETPAFADAYEQAVYELVVELLKSGTLTDATYKNNFDLFGADALIELVTTCGFYTTASLIANTFAVAVPDDERPFD